MKFGPSSPASTASSEPPVGPADAAEVPAAPAPRRPSQREHILDAADGVVRQEGAAHLTLEAVAERAGVSKGGLLYHFKTKELLLQAMVDRHFDLLSERHAAALATLPPGPGRELKAFVRVAATHEKCAEERRAGCSMLAATANDPRLLAPFRRFQTWRLRLIEEATAAGLPFTRMALASLALDGLTLLEMLQLSPYDATQRRAILEDILRLIEETATAGDSGLPPPA